MEEINDLELHLYNGTNEFANKTIHISGNGLFLSESSLENISNLSFHKCVFKGSYLEFENINKPEISICFNDCNLFIDIKFDNCSVRKLQFLNTKAIKKIEVFDSKFQNLYFRNSSFSNKIKHQLNGELSFDGLTINENVKFDYINLSKGNFEFSNSSILDSENGVINFEFSEFQNAEFLRDNFLNEVNFNEFQITNYCKFEDCTFQKSNFSQLRIGVKSIAEIYFNHCKFYKTSIFHYIYGDIYGKLIFESCLFEKYIQFNSSKLYLFELNNSQFNAYVSFQDMFLDQTMSIENVVFEKQANFDDIQIKQIDKCDRKTIRTIKLQLQKAENKIDFNRFRVYEFNAYRKEIKNKLINFEKDKNKFFHRTRQPIQLKRDLFVLWISDIVSEYGTDWKRALYFSLLSGLSIYLLFYSIENYNHTIEIINWENWTRLISGLFRFFLVTDFYNPLETDRVYLTNPLSWLIFIFGKIVIAFGVYEMIQSFRKFKA